MLERQNKIPQTLLETVVDEAPLYVPFHVMRHENVFPDKKLSLADPVTRTDLGSVSQGWLVQCLTEVLATALTIRMVGCFLSPAEDISYCPLVLSGKVFCRHTVKWAAKEDMDFCRT